MDLLKNTIDFVKKNEMNESDIIALKENIKELDKVLKEKNKPKTITISGSSHSIIKSFCEENNLNIGDWCSKVIISQIEKEESENKNKKIVQSTKEQFSGYYKRLDEALRNIIKPEFRVDCIDDSEEEDMDTMYERISKEQSELAKEMLQKTYFESDKLIIGKNYYFIGYSTSNNRPIYRCNSEDIAILSEKGITPRITKTVSIVKKIKTLSEDLEVVVI